MAARTKRLLEDPVAPTLLRLAAPNVLVMVLQAAVTTLDAVFVGWLGPAALAGVSLVYPLVMLMQTMSAGGMGGGVASAVARALGAGRRVEAQALAAHARPHRCSPWPRSSRRASCWAGPRSTAPWAAPERSLESGARLLERGLRRRRRLLAVQHAGEHRPRHRHHGVAAAVTTGSALRLPGPGAGAGPGLGPLPATGRGRHGDGESGRVRHGHPRAGRLSLLSPWSTVRLPFGASACAERCSGRSCASARPAR